MICHRTKTLSLSLSLSLISDTPGTRLTSSLRLTQHPPDAGAAVQVMRCNDPTHLRSPSAPSSRRSSSSSSSPSPSKSSESSATTSGAFGCSISVCASFERLFRSRCRREDVFDALEAFDDSDEDEADDVGESFVAGGGGAGSLVAAAAGCGVGCDSGSLTDPCGAHCMLGDACCRRGSVSSSVSSPGGTSCWAWTVRVARY